jgi:hypothetical protein
VRHDQGHWTVSRARLDHSLESLGLDMRGHDQAVYVLSELAEGSRRNVNVSAERGSRDRRINSDDRRYSRTMKGDFREQAKHVLSIVQRARRDTIGHEVATRYRPHDAKEGKVYIIEIFSEIKRVAST